MQVKLDPFQEKVTPSEQLSSDLAIARIRRALFREGMDDRRRLDYIKGEFVRTFAAFEDGRYTIGTWATIDNYIFKARKALEKSIKEKEKNAADAGDKCSSE